MSTAEPQIDASVPVTPLTGAAAWLGSDMCERPGEWTVELTAAERTELVVAATMVVERPEAIAPMPKLSIRLAQWRAQLRSGPGFLLVRGVPVELMTEEQSRAAFRLIGERLGDPVPQNGAGELLCDIRDTGADPDDPDVRLYTTKAEQDFHTDGADLIGLLCLRPALEGGLSRIASSVTVFNEVARRRPDLVHLLFEDWHWYLHGQQPMDVAPTFTLPITRWDGTALSTFFIGWWIRRAQGVANVPDLTAERLELLETYEDVANTPGIYLDMDFRPGDMQWLRNSVILHKRTAYADASDPAERRHLLRLWLAARDFPDGTDLLRDGFAAT